MKGQVLDTVGILACVCAFTIDVVVHAPWWAFAFPVTAGSLYVLRLLVRPL